MTRYDKYIFAMLFVLCLLMIFSCQQNTNHNERPVPTETGSDETYTSEGTISSGTKDTMNAHTNGVQSNDGELPATTETPIKGETATNANDIKK